MLSDNAPPSVATDNGAGPRHIVRHPNAPFAFVMNELGNSVTAYAVAEDGTLAPVTTVPSLPQDFNGQNTGAHVEITPDGRALYGSNRGHDSIVVLAVGDDGSLTSLEHEPTRGSTPRDFEMDPEGDVLIVANQDSATLAVFAIEADGQLAPLGEPVAGPPSPAAVQMVYLP